MDIVDRLLRDCPMFHSSGTKRWDAVPGTLRAIRQLVRDGDRTLETGCGASTVIFAAAQGAHHTAISPDAEERFRSERCWYCLPSREAAKQITPRICEHKR
jgi:hypothetical protein